MTLLSLTPGTPCAARVYLCARGSRLRTKLLDVKLNHTPNAWEVLDLARRPQSFVASLSFEDGAA